MIQQVWRRFFWLWDVYFGVVYTAVIALVWLRDRPPVSHALLGTADMVALAGWYVLLCRRIMRAEVSWPGRAAVSVIVTFLLYLPVALLVPDTAWALWALTPQMFVISRMWLAAGTLVLLYLIPWLGIVLGSHYTLSTFLGYAPVGVIVIVCGCLIAIYIDRSIEQAEKLARVIDELEASRAQVAVLSREAGIGAERERLAAEIHDTLAQGFTSILTLVQAARAALGPEAAEHARAAGHLDLAAATARENLAEARALVGALTPAALGTGTLTEALRRQATRVTEECGITVDFQTDGELGAPGTAVEVVLLRAAQEALTNVRRHSGASTASLRLTGDPAGIRLVVTDDGTGFDPATPATGFGLAAMRARAEQIGARVRLDSGPAGTVLTVEVPR